MGSEVITALTIQKGNLETNPDGFSPEVSKPITQFPADFDTSSEPIEQRFRARTSPAGHTGSANSSPIEQRGDLVFAPGFPDVESDHALQQLRFVTGNHSASFVSPQSKTPIQQLEFADSGEPVQQFTISTAGSSFSRPIQQEPVINNTVQITQFDFIDLVFPPCFSSKNAVNTNILWRIRDFGLPLDAETLIFKINGIEVQDTPEFVLTSLINGLQLFYNPPSNFSYDQPVVVILIIDDTAEPPNTFAVR